MLFALGLAIASVAVVLALKVIVPLVLRTLALFFAKNGLHRAADNVIRAGDRATQSMRRAIEWSQGEPKSETKARIAEEEANVRVSVEDEELEGEELGEEEPPPKKRAKL